MDLTGAPSRRDSSYSGGNGGACVEVAVVPGSKEGSDYVITMRDSKDPDGPVLTFTPDEWKAFTLGVQDGEFDVEDDSPAPNAPASELTARQLPVQPATRLNPSGPHDLGEPDGINIAEDWLFREDERWSGRTAAWGAGCGRRPAGSARCPGHRSGSPAVRARGGPRARRPRRRPR